MSSPFFLGLRFGARFGEEKVFYREKSLGWNTHAFELSSTSFTRLKSPSTSLSLLLLLLVILLSTIWSATAMFQSPRAMSRISSTWCCSEQNYRTERPNHQLQDENGFYSILTYSRSQQLCRLYRPFILPLSSSVAGRRV